MDWRGFALRGGLLLSGVYIVLMALLLLGMKALELLQTDPDGLFSLLLIVMVLINFPPYRLLEPLFARSDNLLPWGIVIAVLSLVLYFIIGCLLGWFIWVVKRKMGRGASSAYANSPIDLWRARYSRSLDEQRLGHRTTT